MFAPEELADMRDAAVASLPGRCDVTRKTRVRLPNGSWRDVTVVVTSDEPCRKVPTGQTPFEQVVMQTSQAGRGFATFLLDGSMEVYKDDVIRYPAGTGKEYGVAGIGTRTDGEYVRAIVYDDSAAPGPAAP